MLNRVIYKIVFIWYLIQKTNWKFLVCSIFNRSENILIVCPSAPNSFISYFFGSSIENDLALITAVSNLGYKFSLKVGIRGFEEIRNSRVYFNLTSLFAFKGKGYSDSWLFVVQKLEENGNVVIPDLKHVRYWENKVYMHEKFIELEINHPVTYWVTKSSKSLIIPDLEFPVLFKPAHASGSFGIEKIDGPEEYRLVADNTEFNEYLIQRWLNIKKDLRLIFIGEELVLHYWRVNNSAQWKPTSTSFGSSVDFDFLPSQWVSTFFEIYKKLGLRAAAFDIAWQNDDLCTEPLILEVSSSFQPNPPLPISKREMPYSIYKKIIRGNELYYKKYIDMVFDFKQKTISEYEKK